MSQLLDNKLKELQIELTDKQKKQFDMYFEMLIEWNAVMNLTTIKDYEEVNEKHFLDSLSIVKIVDKDVFKQQHMWKVIDIGTGAGFPGIPIKIVFPEIDVILLDSVNKKLKFLNAVIEKLELEGISTIHGRAEDYAHQIKYREQFDICVSRAVSNLSTLSEYCLPYVKVGGNFISYKAGEVNEELEQSKNAVNRLGGNIEEVVRFVLPGTNIDRSLIRINKKTKTAKKYPRKAGMPAKEPLY